MFFFIDMCFVCFVRNNNIKNILLEDDDGIVVEEKLKYILSETVNFKPEIPKNICIDCLKDLNYVYNFKQKCLKSIFSLTDYFEKQTENTSTQETVKIKRELEDINEDMQYDTSFQMFASNNAGASNINTEFENINCEVNIKCEPIFQEDTITQIDVKDILQNEVTNNTDDIPTSAVPEEYSYECDLCEKTFTQKPFLTTHRKIHFKLKSYQCDVCSKIFTSKSHLIRHCRTHTGERPYKCDVCERAFSHKKSLVEHYRIHTGERPYQCEFCDKTFIQMTNLSSHRRTHTGDKPYECDLCDRAYSYKNCLVIHKRTHSGERPFKCDICDKTYSYQMSLLEHKRTHTKERQYACSRCDKTFRYRKSLIKHSRSNLHL